MNKVFLILIDRDNCNNLNIVLARGSCFVVGWGDWVTNRHCGTHTLESNFCYTWQGNWPHDKQLALHCGTRKYELCTRWPIQFINTSNVSLHCRVLINTMQSQDINKCSTSFSSTKTDSGEGQDPCFSVQIKGISRLLRSTTLQLHSVMVFRLCFETYSYEEKLHLNEWSKKRQDR